MIFPDSYFEDEVREGFYIPSLMKRAWAAQMEVFEIVRSICEKHQICYFAEWGTLLGAVRHGGRIPWDDDIDICMLREDYERFREVVNEELPEECWFLDCGRTENYDNFLGRIINSRVHVVEGELLEKYHGFPYVAGIDIFWLDTLPSKDKTMRAYHEKVVYICRLIQGISVQVMSPEQLEYHIKKVESMCDVSLDRTREIKKQLYELLDGMAIDNCKTRNAESITNFHLWKNDCDFYFPKRCYDDSVLLPFENTQILVPAGYKELLLIKYGEKWMEPIRTGGAHDYPSYKKQQEFLREENGAVMFEFHYSEKEVEEVRSDRRKKEELQDKVKEFVPLFQEAHAEIRRGIEAREYVMVLQILAQCQDVAIQLGTMIEGEKGEDQKTVQLLEQYCETIFQLHTVMLQMDSENEGDISEILAKLDVFEQKFSDSIECDLKTRREIIFVPYKSSLWESMESAWKEAMEDPETDVYVMPAPYYYKDDYGRVKKEESHYEMDGYPEEVVLTSYGDYNFETHHPDTIVIQCPYDEYNYGMTVHPFFYAKNLVKYTENLIYIPALQMDEIGVGDDRARENLKSYCNMPGVVYADKVIVQSRQMQKVYIELLTEFAGEDTKAMWERKICVATHSDIS